jgi:hypothetical protein
MSEHRPTGDWDTLEVGLDFGTGTGYRVLIEVGLTPETAAHARITPSTEIQLVTTANGARAMAASLAEAADRADAQNRSIGRELS